MTQTPNRMNRYFLWALILVLPLAIILLNQSDESDAASPSMDAANSTKTADPQSLPPAAERFASLAAIEADPTVKRRPLDIQHWQTSNGARVYFMAAPELPMLDLRLVFDAGSARDDDQAGLAMITSGLLGEGTANLSSNQISRGFESLGAEFGASSYRDMGIASLRSLTSSELLQPALNLFTEVVSKPSFPDDALSRIRNQALASLKYQQQQTGTVANLNFFDDLYGSHPYSIPSQGTAESLKSLSREDLQAFYQRFYVAQNMVIAMVGSLDRSSAERIAERVSNSLPEGQRAKQLPSVAPLTEGLTKHIDHNSQQTQIMIGGLGVAKGDPDYVALYVGNEILGGGGFGSRLMEEVREKRGLTYGVYSRFAPMREQGPFLISLKTRQDQTTQALQVVNDTLTGFLADGPTELELKTAKQNILGSFPQSTASNSSIVGQLGSIGFYDLPLDELDQFLGAVEKITAEEIRNAFSLHVDQERLITITVGQPSKPAEG
ncbi:insulinase family protein [Aestuariirhabdus sp. Z084]|uniref:M16 family metallopeptidase n=1 Tax=Aestuariirhabdus haliotis TaxID=2918751 RepID=UPI00201B4186|nr:pitrilysin family protein [Aestuariirhabdus haliotis]MCL6414173.1 insulinase family protein [Aestuariirhabdus haliotis]MCL6418105.1 insulinase family protein [Aestuariirhabdus haliotis]